jgi:hypothetical protein
MPTPNTPSPFDPPDIPPVWNALSLSARKALARLWDSATQPASSPAVELMNATLIATATGGWSITLRGYQVAAWAYGAGVLP